MKRRSVLIGIGATVSLAGCLGNTPGQPSPTPSPTRSPTPIGDPTFSVTNRSCGSGATAATVSFGDDAVNVDGTIGGRDSCDTALLDGVEWSDDTLTIRVKVAREKTTETRACAQCLTDIEYSVSVPLAGQPPSSVKVIHVTSDGSKTVTTATP